MKCDNLYYVSNMEVESGMSVESIITVSKGRVNIGNVIRIYWLGTPWALL